MPSLSAVGISGLQAGEDVNFAPIFTDASATSTARKNDCACRLDTWAQQGRIRFWVRNLVRREGNSFFLQKADGRFYPDFLCQLPDTDGQPGPVLAVEYKGADRWQAAADDRLIGGLWANLSAGRCRFVMVTNRQWERIEEQL